VNGHRNEFYKAAKALDEDLHVIDTDGCCWVRGCNATKYSTQQDAIDSYEVCGTNTGNSQAGQCDRNTTDFMTPFYGYTTPFIYPMMQLYKQSRIYDRTFFSEIDCL